MERENTKTCSAKSVSAFDEYISLCYEQWYRYQCQLLPALVFASLSIFSLNIIFLILDWKEALSLSHADRNADWFEHQMKLFLHVLDFFLS